MSDESKKSGKPERDPDMVGSEAALRRARANRRGNPRAMSWSFVAARSWRIGSASELPDLTIQMLTGLCGAPCCLRRFYRTEAGFAVMFISIQHKSRV